MESTKIIELLLVVALLPLVISMFSSLKSRVEDLEKQKVDKELFSRLESSLAEHRTETREGFHSMERTLNNICTCLGGIGNGNR
jgi:hypothetical protein